MNFAASALDEGRSNLSGAAFREASEAALNKSMSSRFLPPLTLLGECTDRNSGVGNV